MEKFHVLLDVLHLLVMLSGVTFVSYVMGVCRHERKIKLNGGMYGQCKGSKKG